jgi:hypothetical protein
MEDYSRRNNLIIVGLDEIKEENNEKLHVHVKKLFGEKFQVKADIETVHRLGRPDSNRTRATIVKFKSFVDRQACLRSSAKLKGPRIFLSEDLSRASLEIRKSKLEELREKRRQGFIAYFSGVNIVTKKRQEHGNRMPTAADVVPGTSQDLVSDQDDDTISNETVATASVGGNKKRGRGRPPNNSSNLPSTQ